jgi:hypothetical protein
MEDFIQLLTSEGSTLAAMAGTAAVAGLSLFVALWGARTIIRAFKLVVGDGGGDAQEYDSHGEQYRAHTEAESDALYEGYDDGYTGDLAGSWEDDDVAEINQEEAGERDDYLSSSNDFSQDDSNMERINRYYDTGGKAAHGPYEDWDG